MNDPFFDEDDGEFDDLYGKSVGPTPNSAASSLKRGNHGSTGAYSYPDSPASSVPSSSNFSRSDTNGSSHHIHQKPQRKDKTTSRRKDKVMRRKRSEELFGIDWEDDVHVPACRICGVEFSLVKRKHHCRHCGRVMCSDCSSFRHFEVSHKKHRVCSACYVELANGSRQGREQPPYNSNGRRGPMPSEIDHNTITTPASTSGSRGRFRDTIIHAFTPNHHSENKHRKKMGKYAQHQGAENNSSHDDTSIDVIHSNELPSSDLFNTSDDTWFTEPAGNDSAADRRHTKQSGRGTVDRRIEYNTDSRQSYAAHQTWRESSSGTHTIGNYRHTFAANNVAQDSLFSDQFTDHLDYGDTSDESPTKMPQPLPVAVPKAMQKPMQSEIAQEPVFEPDRHSQSKFKDNLKGFFHGKDKKEDESSRKSRKRKEKWRSKHDDRHTNDTRDPSIPAEESQSSAQLGSDISTKTTDALQPLQRTNTRPTFYNDDADDLIVDDSPGYFEASMKQHEQKQRRMNGNVEWTEALVPRTVDPRRFSTEHGSYSIVEISPETANSQQSQDMDAPASISQTPDLNVSESGGLTGAIKRLFGFSRNTLTEKQIERHETTQEQSTPSNNGTGVVGSITATASGSDTQLEQHSTQRRLSDPQETEYTRYTMVDSVRINQALTKHESFRHTMTGYMSSTSDRFESISGPVRDQQTEKDADAPIKRSKSKKKLKRRDTFEDLFESPKNNKLTKPSDSNSLPTRVWENVKVDYYSNDAPMLAGVDRFDRRREETPALYTRNQMQTNEESSEDEMMEHGSGHHSYEGHTNAGPPEYSSNSMYAAPHSGAVTYVLPTSLRHQSAQNQRANDTDGIDQFVKNAEPAYKNIMDDLSASSSSQSQRPRKEESIDDLFAEFERPTEYVFDAATGGYVAAKVPTRARHKNREPETQTTVDTFKGPTAVGTQNESHYNYTERNSRQIEQYQHITVTQHQGEANDEIDDTIVDKISSLEGELAALKQLIRNRNGHDRRSNPTSSVPKSKSNPWSSKVVSHTQQVRKESIFENDSSEDEAYLPKKPSSKTKTSKEDQQRRNAAKRKQNKRRDSFADLFEDSVDDSDTIIGGKNYEELFQTGQGRAVDSNEEQEEEEEVKAKSSRSNRKQGDYKDGAARNKLSEVEDSVADTKEYVSLKDRSSRRKRGTKSTRRIDNIFASDEESNDEDSKAPSTTVVSNMPSASSTAQDTTTTKSKSAKKKTTPKPEPRDDPIDALFDTSYDRDVTRLYDDHDDDSDAELPQTQAPLPVKATSFSTWNEISKNALNENKGDFVGNHDISTETSTIKDVVTSAPVDIDSDEELFVIDWKKIKSGRSRHPARPSAPSSKSSAPDDQTPSIDEKIESYSPITFDHNLDNSSGGEEIADGNLESLSLAPLAETITQEVSEAVDTELVLDESLATTYETFPITKVNVEDSFSLTAAENASKTDDVVADETLYSTDNMLNEDSGSNAMDNHKRMSLEITPEDEHFRVTDDNLASIASTSNSGSTSKSLRSHLTNSDELLDIFDQSNDISIHLHQNASSLHLVTEEDSDIEEPDDGLDEDDNQAFSFEIKPRKKTSSSSLLVGLVSTPSTSSSSVRDSNADDQVVLLGKYTSAVSSVTKTKDSEVSNKQNDSAAVISSENEEIISLEQEEIPEVDSNWQQLQEEERERKKRLQLKQRQAQRDKLLKKQGVSSRSVSNTSNTPAEKPKKKKKDKERGSTTSTPSSHKKSSTTKRHKHKRVPSTDATLQGSLTEL